MKFKKREIEGSGSFLKFKDGESKVGLFKGEVYEFYQVWENGRSKLVAPDAAGAKSRFRANFVTKENGELKAKIFEFGLTIYNMLAEISDDYEIDKTAIKITRRGMGTDTVYIITPCPPKDQPKADQLKSIDAIPLNILEHKESPEVKNHAPGADDEEEMPF